MSTLQEGIGMPATRSYNKELDSKLGDSAYKRGVYKILCTVNGKYYIGSTTETFSKRLAHHVSELRGNRHKNKYLQNCWNKYGEFSFEFKILEAIEENILDREQYYIDKYFKDKNCMNINPLASGTPNMSKETILKRAETMKRKYATGEIVAGFLKGNKPWNKDKAGSYDTTYLKVPKRITDKVLESRVIKEEIRRENSPRVFVYTLDGIYLGKWRSSKDLEEWSKTSDNLLPLTPRFRNEMRIGKPFNYLSSGNILKSAKTGVPYKGLYFCFTCHIESENKK